jgi:hypothetical protein
MRLVPAGFLCLLTLGACSQTTAPGDHASLHWTRVVGFVDSGGISASPLRTPDTVRAGVPFTITVSTFGSSCIRPAGANVEMGPLGADVTPYDSLPAGPPCLPDWWSFPRDVVVTVATPGVATVRLRGRGFTGDLTFERAITVLP